MDGKMYATNQPKGKLFFNIKQTKFRINQATFLLQIIWDYQSKYLFVFTIFIFLLAL